MKFKNIKV